MPLGSNFTFFFFFFVFGHGPNFVLAFEYHEDFNFPYIFMSIDLVVLANLMTNKCQNILSSQEYRVSQVLIAT